MNLLDENVADSQLELLQRWGFAFHKIGYDVGRKGTKDDAIISFLHSLRRPTFFTRDLGFYKRTLVHAHYGLVVLDIKKYEVAEYSRRVLRHPAFNTEAKRMGTVIRAAPDGLTVWRLHAEHAEEIAWTK